MIDEAKIDTMLVLKENVNIEFKRCGSGQRSDTYESICAFLNHTGGDLLLGVTDEGEVIGLPEKAVDDMMRSIVKVTSDPNQFRPTLAVWPEHVVYHDRHLIYIRVPESPEGDIFTLTVPLNATAMSDGGIKTGDKTVDNVRPGNKSDNKWTINRTLDDAVMEVVRVSPGINRAGVTETVGRRRSVVAEAIARLKAAGKIEYRGSKKTGGYFAL